MLQVLPTNILLFYRLFLFLAFFSEVKSGIFLDNSNPEKVLLKDLVQLRDKYVCVKYVVKSAKAVNISYRS